MSGAEGASRVLLLAESDPGWAEAIAAALPEGWQVVDGEAGLAAEAVKRAEVMLGWSARFAKDATAPDARLKWVQTVSTGVDYLPMAALRDKGVVATSGRGVHAGPVAETALGLMLALARGFAPAAKNAERRGWLHADFPSERMSELQGGTVGLLGTGAIALHLARLCRAFDMRVLALSRSGRPAEGIDRVYPDAEAAELLPQCDYVVNILPGTPETVGFMNAERLAMLKPGAFYVSVGRGKTTDSAALMAALESGRLAGAGLDVTDPEPLPPESPLWAMDQVFILPHLAGFSPRNGPRVLRLFLENLRAYLKTGRPETNVVDYGAGY